MSGFDDAMRKHTAQRQAANDACEAEKNVRLAAAEAAAPRIKALLNEFADRLASSGVNPTTVHLTYEWKKKHAFAKKERVPEKSVTGYVLSRRQEMNGTRFTLVMVTPKGELFNKGWDDSGALISITAKSILAGKVHCAGTVEVAPDGTVGIRGSYDDDPKWWITPEDSIAGLAVKTIENPRWWA